jgi:hypothetical protein
MRIVALIIVGIATVMMFVISVRLNYLFGASLGQSPERAQVFGWISVVADCWKAAGPVFIYSLARSRRWPPAAAASAVWVACFLYAVSSALGIAVQDRAALTGGRETVRAGYEDVRLELEQHENRRRQLAVHRSVPEIDAAIAALLARPVVINERVRGTISSLSLQCTKTDVRTVEICAQIATLREERAVADETARLDQSIAELKQRFRGLRERGGTLSADPQAELLSRLSMGFLSSAEIGFGLVLLLAAVVELVSAFGPVVLSAYADATQVQRHTGDLPEIVVAAGRAMSRLGETERALSRPSTGAADGAVIEYMAERMAPGFAPGGVEIGEIFQDYIGWCQQRGCEALSQTEFVDELDHNRHEHQLEDKIRKFGTRYYGVRLLAAPVALRGA